MRNWRRGKELIEHNAKQLADLEDDWSELGPWRQIDYHCRFSNQDLAEAFAVRAQSAGLQISKSASSHECYVTASVKMEPTAEKITALQERLESFLEWDFENYAFIDGWSYPAKKNVRFWPSNSNLEAIENRAAVLFGAELVEDPLRSSFSDNRLRSGVFADRPRPTFKLLPSEFLNKARAMLPEDPQPTASAFSQWVYSLYGRGDGSEEDVAEGKEAEQDIWQRRAAAFSCNDNKFLRKAGWKWSLVHNGLQLRDRGRPNHFVIPEIRVNGEAVRASPDLVYANEDRSEVIIVEIKFSRQPIPKNLWPNVWAQLWCYSQLNIARSAQKLTVVGEVWGQIWTRGYRVRGGYEPGKALVCLRASVRRDPRAPGYDRFFRKLFEIYARCS